MATKIYIDQGHNPQNPNAGAEGNGYREQDISYNIGVLLAEDLEALGFETRLSRPDPELVLGFSNQSSLSARVNDANAWGADYFISLHTNAAASPSASGTEALVYSVPSRAASLGESILDSLTPNTGLPDRGVIARPGLYVLRRTKMPAVLIELGFITNRRDAELMANSPEIFADGIADGIASFIGVGASAAYSRPSVPRIFDTETEDGKKNEDITLPPSDGARESYSDFIDNNQATGYLKVQAFRGDQVYPVPNVDVRIERGFSDGVKTFFEGKTDENGIIDPIPLPAPSIKPPITSSNPGDAAEYILITSHPEYKDQLLQVTVFDGTRAVIPIPMSLK